MADPTTPVEESVPVVTESTPQATPQPAPSNPFAGEETAFNAATAGAADEMGFDDDSVRQYEYDLYKARKNQTDRLGFLLPTIHGARCHFKKDIGYFVCHSTFKKVKMGSTIMEVPERLGDCCKTGDTARKRFIAPVIQYNTLPTGQLAPDFGFTLKVWRFTDDKYIQLRAINSEYPLTEVDVLITCSNEDWQKLTIQPTRKCLWRDPKFPEEDRKNIKQWTEMVKPKIPRSLARRLSETELREKLGFAVPQQNVVAMETPMIDIKQLLD